MRFREVPEEEARRELQEDTRAGTGSEGGKGGAKNNIKQIVRILNIDKTK